MGRHPRLGAAAIHIDLNTHLQGGQVLGALLAQALCNLEAVDAVHPVKMLGHQTGFVALNRPNAVPLQRQISEGSDLVHAFLNVVFAKGPLPRRMGLAHSFWAPSFGHRQQVHAGRITARGLAGRLDVRAHLRQIFGNESIHAASVPKPQALFV